MSAAAGPPDTSAMRVQAALLDYFAAPGKYQLRRRQPEVLFNSVPEVLQIAAGRGSGERERKLQEAASFFIRAALLYPGADHYSILGLRPRSEPEGLKERYRLLMRLTHPDFAGQAAGGWPADAAVRVNRAYEVLSSPLLRREYDEQLVAAPQKPPAEPVQHHRARPPAARPAKASPLRGAEKAAWTFVVLATLLGLAMLFVPQERVVLVQKAAVPQVKAAPTQASEAPPQPSSAPPAMAERPAPKEGPPARAKPSPPEPRVEVAAVNPAPRAAPPPARVAPPLVADAPAQARAMPPPPAPTPRPQDLAVAINVPMAPATPPAGGNAEAIRVAVVRTPVRPTMTEVQPLLTNLLQLMESGAGDDFLRLLEDDARQHAAAQALSRKYQKMAGRGGRVRLSHVYFKSEPRDDVLVVTGQMRVHKAESTIGSPGEVLLLRAEFASRGGRVVLTSLGGGMD